MSNLTEFIQEHAGSTEDQKKTGQCFCGYDQLDHESSHLLLWWSFDEFAFRGFSKTRQMFTSLTERQEVVQIKLKYGRVQCADQLWSSLPCCPEVSESG